MIGTADRYTGTGVAGETVGYPTGLPVGAGGGGSGTKFENWMLVIIAIFSGYTVSLCLQRSPWKALYLALLACTGQYGHCSFVWV